MVKENSAVVLSESTFADLSKEDKVKHLVKAFKRGVITEEEMTSKAANEGIYNEVNEAVFSDPDANKPLSDEEVLTLGRLLVRRHNMVKPEFSSFYGERMDRGLCKDTYSILFCTSADYTPLFVIKRGFNSEPEAATPIPLVNVPADSELGIKKEDS